jgi:hypothetical protein
VLANIRRAACLLLFALTSASPLSAQTRVVFVGAAYQSEPILAPPALLVSTRDEEREWALSVTGWTMGGDVKQVLTPKGKRHLFVRVTPIRAHASSTIFTDGVRDRSKEFSDASLELGGGFEVAHLPGWTGAYRAIATYDAVRGLGDPSVERFWRRPFIGIDVSERYQRVTSEDVFRPRWEGIKADATLRALTGTNSWAQLRATAGGGRRAGPSFFTVSASAFTGRALNTVSAFLIGGSWDISSPDVLPGYHYAEFRLTSGATLVGGIDLRVHGPWEVGVRSGALYRDGETISGTAVQLTTVWKGALVSAGAAFPHRLPREGNRMHVFATIGAAIVRP